jgi:hypothetical protein
MQWWSQANKKKFQEILLSELFVQLTSDL